MGERPPGIDEHPTPWASARQLTQLLSGALRQGQPPKEVVPQVLAAIHAALPAQAFLALLAKGEAMEVYARCQSGVPLDALVKEVLGSWTRLSHAPAHYEVVAQDHIPRCTTATRSRIKLPLYVGGAVTGFLAVFGSCKHQDMSVLSVFADQLSLALEALAQRERLKATERLKNEVLAGVSHELRTPLAAIKGFAEYVLRKLGASAAPAVHEALARVVAASQRLLGLVEDLLDVGRLDSGTLRFAPAPVQVADAVGEAVATLKPMASAKELELRTSLSSDLGGITADPQRLQQILLNVIGNAVKFTEWGSVTVKAWRRADGVTIQVGDTGPGIPPLEQPLVFRRFYQATSGARQPGAGLGLSIARDLVELHGGTITLASQVGEGSTFTIELPSAPPVAAPTQPPPSWRDVLIVEHHPGSLGFIEQLIAHSFPYRKTLGTAQVRELLAERPAAVLVLDRTTQLPDAFPLDLPPLEVPVVEVSYDRQPERGGVVSFTKDTFNSDEFLDVIQRYLAK